MLLTRSHFPLKEWRRLFRIMGLFPENASLQRSFCGLIDGDGSLGVYERKNMNGTIRRVPYISVTGSKIVCLQFRSFLQKELCEPMPPSVIFYKKSYLFMLSDHRAVKAVKLLYSDCTIALERKLQKALEIMEEFQYTNCDKRHTGKTVD